MYSYTYEEVAEHYIDMVYRLAFARVGSAGYAEDITQDVFLKLLEANPKLESDEHMKAWLIRVTINRSKDLLKSSWFTKTQGLSCDIEEPAPKEDEIYGLLMQLQKKYRTVLYLYYYEEYKTYEIADIIGCPAGTIQSWLDRGRKLLKKQLQREGICK